MDTKTELAKVLPNDLQNGISHHQILFPPFVYQPGAWGFAFLRGIRKLNFLPHGKQRIWEVGCGSGINLLALRTWFPDVYLFFSDLNPRCTQIAEENLARNAKNKNTEALHGEWDLITSPNGHAVSSVDMIIACIPQVPAEGIDPHLVGGHEGECLANYYFPERYPNARLHHVGLGLNETLLRQAQECGTIAPGGRVVLNLSGRPGLSRLKQMFLNNGYTPRVIHEELIPQDVETSLAMLAAMEEAGETDFEFFEDSNEAKPTNARVAETRRQRNLGVFHKIYVVEGTLE